MEVVIGTYEELTIAYKIKNDDQGYRFELSFTDHSHTGSIRAVAVSRRGILATGSSDEIIRIFNLKKHFEIGSLMHHNGMITSLSFHGKTHMFSTSNDGCIGVWQVGKWECLRTLRGHKGPALWTSVHPTGRMALSVGQDKTLRIWNLMTGKCAYITALKQAADLVLWSPEGSAYVVVTNNKLDVYDVETAKVNHTIQMLGRIQTVKFIQKDTVVIGGEEGKVEIHDIRKKTQLLQFSTETNRVKAVDWCQCPRDEDKKILITASSDGHIKLWQIHADAEGWTQTELAEVKTKFRPTCATLYAPRPAQEVKTGKRKSEVKEDEEEEDVEDTEAKVQIKPQRKKDKAKKRKTPGEGSPAPKKKQKTATVPVSERSSPQKTKKKKSKGQKSKTKTEAQLKSQSFTTKKAQLHSKAAKSKSAKFKQRKNVK